MLLRNASGERVAYPARDLRMAGGGPGDVPWTNTNPLRFRLMQSSSRAGVSVDENSAFGLPTFIECVRQPAQLLASLDWGSWDFTQPAVPALDKTSDLANLMEFPGFGTKFDLFQDISASIDGWGGALIQKIKSPSGRKRGKVLALKIVDPDLWTPRDEKGDLVFDVKIRNPASGRVRTETWTRSDALYIRGFNPFGFLTGVIPWQLFKEVLGNAIAIEQFASYWWANQGALSTYISHPEKLSPTQAEEILDVFEESHGGLENAGRPALLSGGAKLEEVRVSVADMQLEASRGWEVSDICRMMDWSYDLINPSPQDRRKTEEIVLKTQKIYLSPRARRIKDAFNSDPDLFKDIKYWLDVRFDPIEAPDAQTRAQANLQNRQAGIVTANELRIPMGLPPHEDGDQLQLTPVGGEANPEAAPPKKGGKGNPETQYDPEGSPGTSIDQ